MKKNLITFITAITACVFIISCASNKEKTNNTSDNTSTTSNTRSTLPSSDAGISMSIQPDKFSTVPETVKMTIVNNSDTVAEYGAPYIVEEYKNNTWEKMPFTNELAFIDILYIQPAGETKEYDISLYPAMANYKKGNYRIRKSINVGNRSLDLAVEFTVE